MAKDKKYVYCFQRIGALEPPFLAELVSSTPQQATLKVGKKTLKANRAACSSTPYTQADLDKFQPHEQPAVKEQSGKEKPESSKPIKGFFG